MFGVRKSGIMNNTLLNDPLKTDDEINNFNFSAHRKHWNPRKT